jgi:lysophospholipase L1-like esterase
VKFWRGLLLAGLVLLGLEGLCRLFALKPVLESGQEPMLLVGSPFLLWELAPGEHWDRGIRIRVNKLQLRGPDVGNKTGKRAIILGDSSIFGFGVEESETVSEQLSKKLGVEVINGGVSGYSSLQSLNWLDMRGLALKPDLLIIASLWSDNNFDNFQDEQLLASYAGFDRSWAGLSRAVLQHSALFSRLDWELRIRPGGETRKVSWQSGDQPRSNKRRVPLRRYLETLDALVEAVEGRAIFLVLPNREDLEPRTSPAWSVYRSGMRGVAKAWDVPVVEGPQVFKQSGISADALFLDQLHPTGMGHRLLAGALAEAKWPEKHKKKGEWSVPGDPWVH